MKSSITTTDFYLAAYLLTRKKQLAGHLREDNQSSFEFEGAGLDTLLNEFYQGNASVCPLEYSKSIRNLKNLMYNGTNFKPLNNYDKTTARKES